MDAYRTTALIPRDTISVAFATLVVAGMAVAVGFAVATVLGASDALPGEIVVVLGTVERPTDSWGPFIHIEHPPTGVMRGMQLGVLSVILGGVPAAILGTALAARLRRRRGARSEGWGHVFLAGFVFQFGSVMYTSFILVLVLGLAYDSAAVGREVAWFVGPLLVIVACSAWGLRAWRFLLLHSQPRPASIAPDGYRLR